MPKGDPDKAKQVLSGWKSIKPSKRFAGMTAEQFEAEIKAADTANSEVLTLENQLGAARDRCKQLWSAIGVKCQMIVASVKGDPEEGLDGDLVQAMGYKKASEKKTGGRRKAASPQVK